MLSGWETFKYDIMFHAVPITSVSEQAETLSLSQTSNWLPCSAGDTLGRYTLFYFFKLTLLKRTCQYLVSLLWHVSMLKKFFLILPVLQHLFSPSVWNQSPVCYDCTKTYITHYRKGKPPKKHIWLIFIAIIVAESSFSHWKIPA